VPIAGDGDCLFTAAAAELQRISKGGFTGGSADLRRTLTAWLAASGDASAGDGMALAELMAAEGQLPGDVAGGLQAAREAVLGAATDEEQKAALALLHDAARVAAAVYSTRMSRSGEWGGAVELLALTRIYNVDVRVWERTEAAGCFAWCEQNSVHGTGGWTGDETTLNLLFLPVEGRQHYDVVLFAPHAPFQRAMPPAAAPPPESGQQWQACLEACRQDCRAFNAAVREEAAAEAARREGQLREEGEALARARRRRNEEDRAQAVAASMAQEAAEAEAFTAEEERRAQIIAASLTEAEVATMREAEEASDAEAKAATARRVAVRRLKWCLRAAIRKRRAAAAARREAGQQEAATTAVAAMEVELTAEVEAAEREAARAAAWEAAAREEARAAAQTPPPSTAPNAPPPATASPPSPISSSPPPSASTPAPAPRGHRRPPKAGLERAATTGKGVRTHKRLEEGARLQAFAAVVAEARASAHPPSRPDSTSTPTAAQHSPHLHPPADVGAVRSEGIPKCESDGTPHLRLCNLAQLQWLATHHRLDYAQGETAKSLRRRLAAPIGAERVAIRAQRASRQAQAMAEGAAARVAGEVAATAPTVLAKLATEAPRVVGPRGADGNVGDFGPASDPGSFLKLARWVTKQQGHIELPADADLASMGACKCPACRVAFSVVGKHCELTRHLGRQCESDASHRLHVTAHNLQPGWIGKLVNDAHGRAAPGSPARYYNEVISPHIRGATHVADPEGLLRTHEQWMEAEGRRRQRGDQWRPPAATGAAASRFPAVGGQPDPASPSAAPPSSPPQAESSLPPPGGATARRWGTLPASRFKGSAVAGDWEWLDDFSAEAICLLDVVVRRQPPTNMRRELLDVLALGFEYFADHSREAAGARGLKFVVLAKAVTTGCLRGGGLRAAAEVHGRIRQVRAGHLRPLVSEMLEERLALEEADEVAEEAAAAERARAQDEQRSPRVQQARLGAVAARLQAAGVPASRAFALAAAHLAGPSEKKAPPSDDPLDLGDDEELRKVLARALRLCSAGYLSKGYAQFRRNAVADTRKTEVCDKLRSLHGQMPPPPRLGTDATAFQTNWRKFVEVFQAVPKERGLGVDAVSYEELGHLFHTGKHHKQTLFRIVRDINAGAIHTASVDILGESSLIGIDKPGGKGVRPIGVGSALRRMAGRCIYKQLKEEFGAALTKTAPTAEQLQRAGFAADRACNRPLQLGCGVAGGPEIIVKMVRVALENNPEYAILSDDKVNGYNTLSREAILRGVERFFPELLPTVEMWYCRKGGLYYRGMQAPARAVDGDGVPFFSSEGCTQGDPLGPILWCLAYHATLLDLQARYPDCLILCYLDDTYYLQVPEQALACMRAGTELAEATADEGGCGVTSNLGKQEVYSPTASLDCMPPTLRGAPTAPPDPESGYEGGRLLCIRVLGAYVADGQQGPGDEACTRELLKRVRKHLGPLRNVPLMRDDTRIKTTLQVQLEINRFCANTNLTYFERIMPLHVTHAASQLHDSLVNDANADIVVMHQAHEACASRAKRQSRLPVKMGGLGLSSHEQTAPAAVLGGWALCWAAMQELCPREFADIDLGSSTLRACVELQQVHADLMERYHGVAAQYRAFDTEPFDFDKAGVPHFRFHPEGLPGLEELAPISLFGSTSDDDQTTLQHAQSVWSSIIHHSEWYKLLVTLGSTSLREAVRFIAVSQPCAGAFLNAVPALAPFRMGSWALRIFVQRRLGLPLSAAAVEGALSKHGLPFDVFGDVGANDGVAGHQTRHHQILQELVKRLRSVYGVMVEYEPPDYRRYSDKRPDVAVHYPEGLELGDTKVFDPVGSDPSAVTGRGAHVGFGNTLPEATAIVVGWKGRPGEKVFSPLTGQGRVAEKKGEYERAMANGIAVTPLLFETFGGFSPGVMRMLQRAIRDRGNKLRGSEYDETTWSARTWKAFTTQRMSCAIVRVMAWEIATAMQLPRSVDMRGA
jgi:hypothetical protein